MISFKEVNELSVTFHKVLVLLYRIKTFHYIQFSKWLRQICYLKISLMVIHKLNELTFFQFHHDNQLIKDTLQHIKIQFWYLRKKKKAEHNSVLNKLI